MEGLPAWIKSIIALAFAFADFWIKVIRPLLTTSVYMAFIGFGGMLVAKFPIEFIAEAQKHIGTYIFCFMYIATTIILSWFGNRELAKRLLK